ncbi:MAG: DUF2225 domain-containing protein [Spirochaetales bacterium]|nr:DUF2225 domain-containing protein [Spirochaetales bacterium]
MSEGKVSYIAKNSTICPVCETEFKREELLTGGGRMNAGDLTDELHRQYLPTGRFGDVYPLIYPVTVCPNCFYAAYVPDFDSILVGTEAAAKLKMETGDRKNLVKNIDPQIDFHNNRTLKEGIASYLLAMSCYEEHSPECAPTFRQAVSALRGGWLSMDFHKKIPDENWDYLAQVFFRKAAFFYSLVIENEENGKEQVSSLGNLGPDVDNNYGFDGVLYLAGLLEFKYGQRTNVYKRGEKLKKARSTVARIVGMGKSSKAKPGPLLESSRDLHKRIKQELDEMGLND